jgi:hypothetical protein
LQALPSLPIKHEQLDFRAQAGSQPQAGPPAADSSQYQPLGQMPEPHGLHVPSSHAAGCGARSSGDESSLAVSSAELGSLESESRLLAEGALGAVAEPPQAADRSGTSAANSTHRPVQRVAESPHIVVEVTLKGAAPT